MTVTTFQQATHPELSATVTEISQDIIVGNFELWFRDCIKIDNCRMLSYRTFKAYYKQGLTPKQAVNKYFL